MDPDEDVVTTHLAAWNAPEGQERDRLIATAYADEVFIGEPEGSRRGHDGMREAISALQAQLPGTALTRTGGIQQAQDLITYSWDLGAPGRPPVASGRDVLLVRDDQIVSLYIVIDAP